MKFCPMLSKNQFKKWFDRYKYAELAAITATLLATQFHYVFDAVTTAYLITVSEYIAYYSVIVTRDYVQETQKASLENKKRKSKISVKVFKNVLLEFGYPALLDLALVRPYCMFWLPILTGNVVIGTAAGKICADLVFYFFTIVNYESLIKKNSTK
jgi:hypothetical protein